MYQAQFTSQTGTTLCISNTLTRGNDKNASILEGAAAT